MAYSMQSSFLDINPGDLNKFIDDKLQPDQGFLSECSKNMDFLAEFLRNKSDFSVAETIKGGSLGKGTAIKGKADLDVVMYVSNRFHDMQSFLRGIGPAINDLKREIKRWSDQRSGVGRVNLGDTTRHAVKMSIQYSRLDGTEEIDVDLLPAINILAQGKNTAYQRLDNLCPGEREYFSSSLVSLQLEFVRKQLPNVKNLIRLVKHWRKTNFEGSAGIPTSYVFELLTIHAWEKAGKPRHFNTAKAFKSILTMLQDYGSIEAFWTDNYNKGSYSNAARKAFGKPYILDPANPFNNVCIRFNGWDKVAQVARRSLERPLFRGVTGHPHNWI